MQNVINHKMISKESAPAFPAVKMSKCNFMFLTPSSPTTGRSIWTIRLVFQWRKQTRNEMNYHCVSVAGAQAIIHKEIYIVINSKVLD